MGDGYCLAEGLTEARTISRAWGCHAPHLADEYESACNWALAQACLAWDGSRMTFRDYCRFLMYRRCRDVYRVYVRDRGRERPTLVGGTMEGLSDEYLPSDLDWKLRQVIPHIATLPGLALATQRAVTGVLLYLELGSMEAVAERMGVSESRVSQYLAEVARGIKVLKVAA